MIRFWFGSSKAVPIKFFTTLWRVSIPILFLKLIFTCLSRKISSLNGIYNVECRLKNYPVDHHHRMYFVHDEQYVKIILTFLNRTCL